MKIRRLDLMKFGPFDEQSLSFTDGASEFHLIYGPNEAGKTSTLRALHQLLFGMPGETKCRDNFLHQYDKLRIGAELEDSAGNVLHIVRRKGGRTTSLLGPDNRSKVSPDKLDKLLGNIDAARFKKQFGIDYEQLREGGAGILEGGGDLGTSLFAAGAGQANFAAILKSLTDDCENLFKERGRNQEINSGLSRLADAQKAVRQAQLSESTWSDRRKSLNKDKIQRDELQQQLLTMQADTGRLNSFLTALPLIGEFREVQKQLQPLADLPQLRDDFTEARRSAVAAAENATRSIERATKHIEGLDCEISDLNVKKQLLTNAAMIESLSTDLGRYRELLAELPKLKTRREQHLANIRRLNTDLGITDDSEKAAGHSITAIVRQGIRDLSSTESGIRQSVQSATKLLREAQEELAEATKALDGTNPDQDTLELDSAIERIRKQGDLEQKSKAAVAGIERTRQQLEIDLKKKLQLPGSVEEAERLPVPSVETVSTFEKQFADAASKTETLQKELSNLQHDLNATESALQRISLGHDVPTEEDLSAARQLRQDAWKLLRATLEGEANKAAISKFLKSQKDAVNLQDAYEQAVARADDIADRLRREAEKVAEKSQRIADQHKLQKDIELCQGRMEKASSEQQRLNDAWQKTWEAAAVVPRDPRTMSEWLRDHAQILEDAEELREEQLQQQSLTKQIDEYRLELTELLQPFTEQDYGNKSLEQLLDSGRQISERVANEARQRSGLEADVARLTKEAAAAEKELAAAQEAQTVWLQNWAAATASLQSAADITPSQASKLMDAFDDRFSDQQKVEELDAEIATSEAEISKFEQSAEELKTIAEFTSSSSEAAICVLELKDALSTTRTNESLRRDKQQQREVAQHELRDSQDQQQQATTILKQLCEEAGCSEVDELSAVEENCRQRGLLRDRLASLRSQLQQLAGAGSVDDFINQVTAEDAATIEPRLEQLQQEVAQLEKSRESLSESIGSSTNELAKMDGSAEAASAQTEVEQIRAKLHSDTEEYVRAKLALTILKNAVDRYRKQNQGPVLQRASELFQRLTLGAFSELIQDVDDSGKPLICGYRPSDQSHVGVQGMSEGTCDQLYLALRLATLEVWLDQHPDNAIPFIVDDILIQFDDERSAAALQIFAELSQRTQVIMFTHHQHLVDVAQETLAGTGVLSVQTLERSVMTGPVGA